MYTITDRGKASTQTQGPLSAIATIRSLLNRKDSVIAVQVTAKTKQVCQSRMNGLIARLKSENVCLHPFTEKPVAMLNEYRMVAEVK